MIPCMGIGDSIIKVEIPHWRTQFVQWKRILTIFIWTICTDTVNSVNVPVSWKIKSMWRLKSPLNPKWFNWLKEFMSNLLAFLFIRMALTQLVQDPCKYVSWHVITVLTAWWQLRTHTALNHSSVKILSYDGRQLDREKCVFILKGP